ncbi:MAG: glutamine--fructose-6-phosphate transaminase (isomerizing) [Acidimicrobiia bacterium]|nr:glutamine--fructose-6-phosphate transaminase (isomerizing) [Acidimicrobiia bacterium]MDH4306947.1 glutamine--fructose-6-phosphate transaminase (isomerizing) [Acidimicrobiia bacterium]MDH5292897.1 glutamine--fructose-6-phosphate transaminase (isomerizing) [Acidimicrobiia bacterium]
MCGIVGYAGPRPVLDVLVPGLERLEYRGYDSAGIAVETGSEIAVVKQVGRIADLERALETRRPDGGIGVGHTRWATHGAPNTINAHPHLDCSHTVSVVHNGIIENWADLKSGLIERGHSFASDTDTEVVAHLLEEMSNVGLAEAVRRVMSIAEGALALCVMRRDEPDVLVGARRGSPLVVGLGDGENFLASDIPAFLEHTRRMLVVDDDRVVELRADDVRITDLDGMEITPKERVIEWDLEAAERGGYETFMLKEINEQPSALADTLRGRVDPMGAVTLRELTVPDQILRMIDKVFVLACGTSYHAAMMAKYAIERWTRLPVEIDIASEFRYRDPVLDGRSLVIGISQSGETIDTLAAIRYAKAQGSTVIGVTNVVDSALAREADAVLYTRAGPEIGVAATKTFTTQLVAMQLLGLYLAQVRGALDPGSVAHLVRELSLLPEKVTEVLGLDGHVAAMCGEWADVRDFFFLGRSGDFPVAMEGALKLKEIAYVRAEGYAAGEMKHGPIALIEPGVVVVGVAMDTRIRSKTLSNMQEMKARGATIVMVVEKGAESEVAEVADHVIALPDSPDLICTVLAVVPLQLLSYHVATAKGLDVDKPRNLAKTVTVE